MKLCLKAAAACVVLAQVACAGTTSAPATSRAIEDDRDPEITALLDTFSNNVDGCQIVAPERMSDERSNLMRFATRAQPFLWLPALHVRDAVIAYRNDTTGARAIRIALHTDLPLAQFRLALSVAGWDVSSEMRPALSHAFTDDDNDFNPALAMVLRVEELPNDIVTITLGQWDKMPGGTRALQKCREFSSAHADAVEIEAIDPARMHAWQGTVWYAAAAGTPLEAQLRASWVTLRSEDIKRVEIFSLPPQLDAREIHFAPENGSETQLPRFVLVGDSLRTEEESSFADLALLAGDEWRARHADEYEHAQRAPRELGEVDLNDLADVEVAAAEFRQAIGDGFPSDAPNVVALQHRYTALLEAALAAHPANERITRLLIVQLRDGEHEAERADELERGLEAAAPAASHDLHEHAPPPLASPRGGLHASPPRAHATRSVRTPR